MKVGKLGWLVAMFLSGGMAVAQGTADDYRRAYALKEKFSADKVFYSSVILPSPLTFVKRPARFSARNLNFLSDAQFLTYAVNSAKLKNEIGICQK